MIRVMVVDDHQIVRDGLVAMFEGVPDIEVVASVSGGEEAVVVTAGAEVDIVLMDLSMPDLDGADATRRIMEQPHPPLVVVLTTFADQPRILGAIDAGATGYLLKDADPEDIVRGVRAAFAGEAPFSPRAAKALLTLGAQRTAATELTRRERDVLLCVAEGLSNKLIARRLGISEKTVKTHLGSVFQRIGVSDRTQAALWAQRHHLAADER